MNRRQVNLDFYFLKKYISLERFISYFKQIDLILGSGAKKILFIGVGDGTVVDYLKKAKRELEITTYDFDPDLNPDVVGDVRNILFEDGSFDAVVAFEVLEHIPYEDVSGVLNKISKISKLAIISLPSRRSGFEFILKFPFIRTLLKRDFIDIRFTLPLIFLGFKESGQHYWEIDRSKFSFRKIKNLLNTFFLIESIESMPLDLYRNYFVLISKINKK